MDPQRLRATIRAARAGREEAYQEILAAFGPRLYGYFVRATGSRHDAEDLLGEVMLRLVGRLPEYDEKGRFEQWVFRIASNLVRDRIRRAKVRPMTSSLEAESPGGGVLGETIRGRGRPAEAGLRHEEVSQALNEALERLDEPSRQMVLLRHFAEMSFREIAEIFQCPIGTVLAKVHRALKALRTVLEANDESDAGRL
jgi:RNA polymerase sigma-70 factor (ECF subfamily)